MLRAVGLDAAARRDVVLQAWLHEETDVGREVVLHTETCADGQLPWGTEHRLVGSFQCTM